MKVATFNVNNIKKRMSNLLARLNAAEPEVALRAPLNPVRIRSASAPIVDRQVLQFVQTHTFHPADFTIQFDGVCRINSEMTKKAANVECAELKHAAETPRLFG
jgi:exonuclease III